MKKLGLLLLLLIICAVGVGFQQYYRLEINNIESRDSIPVRIYVYPNTSFDSLTSVLQEHYEIHSLRSWQFHARLMHFSQPKVGCYCFDKKQGNRAVIQRLRSGEQTPVEVTIHRIRTRAQLANRLSSQLLLDSLSIISRLEDNDYMAKYGLKKETAVCLFLPNTYELYWTISPDALFERMSREYQHFWTDERQKKAKALGLDRVGVATIASIAEEETNKDFEYPIIAGLYINRLNKGMCLQACPTVKFAWQDFSLRRILKKHLEIDSPYNTYRNQGLPPGPIRIPRASTMDAVLNRTPSDYLFMCASADFNGTHHFSSTYQEHARYAREYQAELNRRKIK